MGKGEAQSYTDFYKRNTFAGRNGESKSISIPENKGGNPFELSIRFGSTAARSLGNPFRRGNDDDDDARKAAIRRRLKKKRGK